MLSTLSTLPPFLFAGALSSYGLYLCQQNISRLQQYESASEKAAEWSNTAAYRLRKTRATQTSGTVALALSFIASTTLPFLRYTHTPALLGIVGIALGALLYTARTHMHRFWNERNQVKIPLVEQFNDAIRGSERVVVVLETLAFSWGIAGCVWALEWGALGVGLWLGVVGARAWWAVGMGGGEV